ncbi:MAG: RNA polymerase sigma factor FliA [Burkholderiaceae bacterium]|nr:MAG: RNA polymerase sigma factor FliA [Burkholderiaceae bacterium]
MYTEAGTLDRQEYLEKFSPLVRRMAHHMLAKLPASVQLDDLIQAGLIGLMDAIGRFEEGQGAQFETYATQRIRGAMLDELRHGDWLPRGLRKTQRQIESAMHKLEHRFGRAPSEGEVAKELGVPLPQYQEMLQEAKGYQLIYFDQTDEDEGGDNYLDRNISDTESNPIERISDARFRAAVIKAIDNLPEREKLLMGLYYEQELNFREIAEVLGVTESRVCQLHSQAVARLRTKLRDW